MHKPITEWFKVNKLSLNITKTEALAFRSTSYDSQNLPAIQTDEQRIELVDHTWLLGVEFDAKLSWNIHLSNILGKLSGIKAILYKLRNTLSHTWLINLYNTHFLPFLMYCCTVWCNISKHLTNRLSIMQKWALRIMLHVERRTNSAWVYANSTIMPLEGIREYQVLVLMYKYLHDLLLHALWYLFCPED